MSTKKGFTIAEILTTLMVIAIVAAMTIPQLKKHQHRTEFETRLKKAYLTLEQSLDSALLSQYIEENGVMQWKGNAFQNNLAPELVAIKICNTSATMSQCMTVPSTTISYAIVTADGMSFGANDQTYYVDLNGPAAPNVIGKDIYVFELMKTSGYNKTKKQYTSCTTGSTTTNCEWKIVPSTSIGSGITQNIAARGWKITEW